MRLVRNIISILGFTEAEVRAGLPDLFDEFRHRPWIICPDAAWKSETSQLVITTHYEGDDPDCCTRGALDEIRDCIIACLSFSSAGIHFDVEEATVLPAT